MSLKSNWIAGPKFLCASSVITLKTEFIQVEVEDVEKHTHLIINHKNNSDISVLKWEHYSSYFKLLRHVAYILKMKHHWINVKRKHPKKINYKKLTVSKIKTAEHQIIAQAQRDCYHEGLNSLKKPKPYKSQYLVITETYVDRQFIACGRKSSSFILTI